MSATTTIALDDVADLVAALANKALADCTRDDSGCLLHPTGRLRFLGGALSVKKLLWAHAGRPLPDGHLLLRNCSGGERCQEVSHHAESSRQQWGQWLGSGSTWRRKAA